MFFPLGSGGALGDPGGASGGSGGALEASLKTQKSITLGMNGAAVPRHGLILSQDGATHSRKVSRYLPGLRDALKTSKTVANVKIKNFKHSKI